ncbi:uncharacterized protein [Lepeophtheirus salmonis]|nr:uncharacterized protein LOC121114413 isoform X2 [Lepeophtheirus salmonis]
MKKTTDRYCTIFILCMGISFILGVKVPVKRLHSRQRRFVAPGALWDVRLGINILWPDANLIFDIILRHQLDDLFGGLDILQNRLMTNSYEGRSGGFKTNSSNLNVNLIGRKKRNAEDDNYLVRSLEEDQVSILSKLEEAITKGGMNGRHCVLKAICELQETPIHEWSVLGEMISVLFRPKKGYHSELLDYKKAEKLGSETGKCWSHYPNCPISIFNIIPDLYTKDDVVNINFDGGVESELP